MTAALSSASIATAVTGIGAFASLPIGAVAAITGVSSTILTGFSKKIQYKLTKHEKLYTLAITKKNTVCELVSKALNDNKISDSESNLVLRELEKFHELNAAIRAGNTNFKNINNDAQVHTQPPQPSPDVEKIKTQLRKEIKQELEKKCFQIWTQNRASLWKTKLRGFSLYLTKERIRGDIHNI